MRLGLSLFVFSILTVAVPARAARELKLPGSGASVGYDFYSSLPQESHIKGSHVKLSGPQWLEVTEDGVAAGVPNREAAGENEFRIEVTPVEGEKVTLVYPIFVRVIDDH